MASATEGSEHHGLVMTGGDPGGDTRRRELRLSARMCGGDAGNSASVSQGHGNAGNGASWKAWAPARCFGIVGSAPARVSTVPVPCVTATVAFVLRDRVARAVTKGPGTERVVGRSDSLRRVGALEVPASAEYRTGGWVASVTRHRRRDGWVRARRRGKPKGATGSRIAATRWAGNGLSAGQPLRWVRLLESVQVSAGAQDGRRADHERGWSTGERASDGAVTVATSPGGKRSEGSVPVGMVGRRRQRRRSACNRANPMVGSGMQQARTAFCGTNRRSREKRQGRHCRRGWQPLRPVFGSGQQDAEGSRRWRGGL